jgi:hypothetical protein
MTATLMRRLHPRRRATIDLMLTRPKGNPVMAKTIDLGGGGMCITSTRPLTVDELLDFDLLLGTDHVIGHARVLREQGPNVYALRFEDLPDPALERVIEFVVTG